VALAVTAVARATASSKPVAFAVIASPTKRPPSSIPASAVRLPGSLRRAAAVHPRLASQSAHSGRSGVSPNSPMDISGSKQSAKKVRYARAAGAPAARAAAKPIHGIAVAARAVKRCATSGLGAAPAPSKRAITPMSPG
jgi:hypothetical protein